MRQPHIYLHPRCGACGDDFSLGQKIVSAVRKSRSIEIINAYTFPDGCASGHFAPPDTEWYFCRRPSCSECDDRAADAATIHVDCYHLFRQRCKTSDALYRLWLTAAWRRPWHRGPSRLAPDVDASKTMLLAATACSLPQLTAVPAEILQIIGAYAQPSPLSRYRTVIDLAADWNGRALTSQPSLPLSKIASWERDGRAVVERNLAPIVKMTIDCWGLKRIERLTDYPPFTGKRSDTEVYIIETDERLKDAMVRFQSGLARLHVPKEAAHFQLWDTPAPPPLGSLQNIPKITSTVQFATVDFRKAHGLTLFVADGSTLAVHGHTRRRPRPDATFHRLPHHRQRYTAWVYVPFPSKDRLTHFGIRAPHRRFTTSPWILADYSYLFRFELAGDVIIGPHFRGPTQDIIWPVKEQLLLIFNVAELAVISTMSAYPNQSKSSEMTSFARFCKPPLREASFSSVSLENVALLHIYTDADTGRCRGILVEYNNGSRRTLGECRIGLDSVCTCKNPACLCFTAITRIRAGTPIVLKGNKVSSSASQSVHTHDEEGWTCLPMQGDVEFWFTSEQSILRVMDEAASAPPSGQTS